MGVPKSVIKFDKNGVQYISSVDYYQYSIQELSRAALRDVGKLVSRYANKSLMRLPGMKRNPRSRGKGSPFQYWVLRKEGKLYVGSGDVPCAGHFGRGSGGFWYGIGQELGNSKTPKLGILTNTVRENIEEIIKIESQYLTGVPTFDESKIDEGEYQGGADE